MSWLTKCIQIFNGLASQTQTANVEATSDREGKEKVTG
jgi:hypothetical protein